MQRLQPPNIDENHPSFDAVKRAEKYIGFALNDGKLMAHQPEITSAFEQLTQSILGKGKVDADLKRLMGLVTSLAAGCRYCASHTSFSANKLGVPKAKIEAVWEYEKSDLFSEKEKAAIAVAAKAGMAPNQVSDEDFQNLQKHFDAAEIIEIVSVISLYAYLNKFNSTLATEIEAMPRQVFDSLNTAPDE